MCVSVLYLKRTTSCSLLFLAFFKMCYLCVSKKQWTLLIKGLWNCCVELLSFHSSEGFQAAFHWSCLCGRQHAHACWCSVEKIGRADEMLIMTSVVVFISDTWMRLVNVSSPLTSHQQNRICPLFSAGFLWLTAVFWLPGIRFRQSHFINFYQKQTNKNTNKQKPQQVKCVKRTHF